MEEKNDYVQEYSNKIVFHPADSFKFTNLSSTAVANQLLHNQKLGDVSIIEDDNTSCSSNSMDMEILSLQGFTLSKLPLTDFLSANGTCVNEFFERSRESPRAHLQVKDKFSTSYHLDFDLTNLTGCDVYNISDLETVEHFINARIESQIENNAFLVTNLGAVLNQFLLWKSELPMITPFYAVKCLPDIAILRLLASLGCSFDCATQGEIETVLYGLGDELNLSSRNLASTNIVYANPSKMEHMIKYAINNGVSMTVFDGEDELYKIAAIPGFEKLQLLLRLTTDDKASVCQFSKKYGCPVDEAPRLLAIAKDLGINIAGVSFHVGSGCGDSNAYITALEHTRRVFDAAEELGMKPLTIIDIGGGFPGDKGGYGGPNMPTFQDLAAAVRKGLDNFAAGFNRSMNELRIIAEPGRFFVSASTTVATKVYSRKGGNRFSQALYVDDGVYGTFNNIVYDHATPIPLKLASCIDSKIENTISTVVFGPTCDGLDQLCSLENTRIARCEVNDWLIWKNMGAYTHTASFVFNGYTHVPTRCYCFF